jgi:predicted nucleotidyltransferase
LETKLEELTKRLKIAAGENLRAVVLYGSAVTGEFFSGQSDLNILCVLDRAGAVELEQLHASANWWMRENNPAPLVFTLEELRRSADIFAIELLDMKMHHRMLHGEDFLEAFEIPLTLHRLQVERELRTSWLRLRQAILAAPHRKRIHLAIMLSSISAFCVLFRHALVALGHAMPTSRREAVDLIASLTGADPTAFRAVLELKEGKRRPRQMDIPETLRTYLEFVEVVTNEIDHRLEVH